MSSANVEVRILTAASCSNVRAEHRSHVVVSGSYGGRYNAFNAAKWPVRAVIMNDAGIGKDRAGIVGLDFLDQIDLAAANVRAWGCSPHAPRAGVLEARADSSAEIAATISAALTMEVA
jgi:hypothetical protein